MNWLYNRIRAAGWRRLRENHVSIRAALRCVKDENGFKLIRAGLWTWLFERAEGYSYYYRCVGEFPVRTAARQEAARRREQGRS